MLGKVAELLIFGLGPLLVSGLLPAPGAAARRPDELAYREQTELPADPARSAGGEPLHAAVWQPPVTRD